jgi:hypothetical protein
MCQEYRADAVECYASDGHIGEAGQYVRELRLVFGQRGIVMRWRRTAEAYLGLVKFRNARRSLEVGGGVAGVRL